MYMHLFSDLLYITISQHLVKRYICLFTGCA